MKRFWPILLLLAATSCVHDRMQDLLPDAYTVNVAPGADPALAYIFDESVLPEIHIKVLESEWNRLLAAFDADVNTEEYVYCTATYIKGADTTVVPWSGLKLRGNSSRRRPEGSYGKQHDREHPDWHHAHFGVNFHKYVKDEDHKVHGMQKLLLKWFKDDPLYVREIYCFDLFRRYGVWTAVNDVHCRVFLQVGNEKEAYFGVYQMMEPVDEHYLKRRKELFKYYGGHENGYLWKCRWGSGLRAVDNMVDDNFNNDDDTHNHPYTLKTHNDMFPQAKEMLQDFIEKVNMRDDTEFAAWVASACDVQLLLRTIAVTVAVGSWDDYWNNHNNWYLYFDSLGPDYRFWYIPYDFDYTLGRYVFPEGCCAEGSPQMGHVCLSAYCQDSENSGMARLLCGLPERTMRPGKGLPLLPLQHRAHQGLASQDRSLCNERNFRGLRDQGRTRHLRHHSLVPSSRYRSVS